MYPWLQKTYDFLVDSYHANKLHHAYLLVFDGDIGQEELIARFSQFLLCKENQNHELREACGKCRACQAYSLKSNTDLFDLHLDDPSKAISIDTVRTMIDRVGLEPSISSQNVVTILDASKLGTKPANAMLKTLEEPPPHTVFLIGLPAGFSILPTIRSRCLVLHLPQPDQEQIEEFLTAKEIHQPERSYLKSLAPGQPALMLKMQEKNFVRSFLQLNQHLLQLFSNLEVDDFVAAFDCKDSEVFIWQLEALSKTLTYAGKKFFLNSNDTFDALDAVINFEQNSAFALAVEHIQQNLQKDSDVEKLYDLVDRLLVLQTQLKLFTPQLGVEGSLLGIAYKVASLTALFAYSLMNISDAQTFYRQQLEEQKLKN
ncbi:hypothetical protein CJP74_05385 [Psittacicella melopsittaci]|uniref:DNA-directed DNA polymerase n=1 Tax=Psittacicella melopsittaci TaxID=2028576 RepID=A0A3A1Y468_9GAMM|nr:hypothetical protein [Psittacicella melopsittaci]RIY32200.1 hypothetical protein CJP74_05385 [Psittacicella melopsittaci]